MRSPARHALAAAATLIGLTVPALGAAVPAGAAAPKPVTVQIKSFTFKPATVRVKVGQKIVVKNADTTAHTMTEGATDSHGDMKMSTSGFDTKSIAPGKSATLTLKKPGTYAFHCHIHPTMTGKVIVRR